MFNPLKWSATFLHGLYLSGSRYIFISPGSRSTPLTLAAALHPGFKQSIILDERSAAFAALGAARRTGTPSILICTSGTAAANYYPAIIEAKESGVSLIVLTADRPPVSRQTGSSQTIDQIKLYGNNAIFFHEAGEPVDRSKDYNRVMLLAKQAYRKSVTLGGAAHINFPFRKPLEPSEEQAGEVLDLYLSEQKSLHGFDKSSAVRSAHLDADIVRRMTDFKKPLIIGGVSTLPHNLAATGIALSELLSAPIIAEPGSWYPGHENRIDRFEQILRNLPKKQMPDLIIRTGDQPFTKSVIDFLTDLSNIPVLHFTARAADQDEAMNVTQQIVVANPEDLQLPDLGVSSSDIGDRPKHWLNTWLKAEQTAQNKLDEVLSRATALNDGHVVRIFSEEAAGFQQMISNSFTPRDLALFGTHFGPNHLNRGAAGIDGILSTAAGIATVSEAGDKVYCLAGDLAFLHDSNALYTIRQLKTPLITVVVNNSGGMIFQMLPLYRKLNRTISDEMFQTYFETPHQISIQKLAEAAGLAYYKASTIEELQAAGLRKLTESTVVECVTDPVLSMDMRQKLWGGY